MMNGIASVSPTVEILYKNKDDVLEDIRKKDPNLVTILEKTNPLPATIELSNINIQDYDAINREIQQRIFVLEEGNPLNNGEKTSVVGAKKWDEHFSNYTSQYDNIMQVISVLTTLQWVLYIIIAIFVFSISIIIYSIIGNFIYYYRDEIYITRLVWWSKFFIYGPFSIQGMIYSFVSFLLSLLIFVVLLKNANLLFPWEYTLNFLLWQSWLIFLLEGLVFLFIWWLSGLISSRKYLKQ